MISKNIWGSLEAFTSAVSGSDSSSIVCENEVSDIGLPTGGSGLSLPSWPGCLLPLWVDMVLDEGLGVPLTRTFSSGGGTRLPCKEVCVRIFCSPGVAVHPDRWLDLLIISGLVGKITEQPG